MAEIVADPKSRPKHWLVDGQIVAGAETAEDALAIIESLNHYVEPSEPTSHMINAERERRKSLPKTVTIDGVSFPVDCDRKSRENIDAIALAGSIKASLGDTSTINFTDANNVDHVLDNAGMQLMGVQIMAQMSAIHDKARALKAMDPNTVTDHTEDSYWT